jgi:hypothetical protein
MLSHGFGSGLGSASLTFGGGAGSKLNKKFADMNLSKILEPDYEDRVACNCCSLNVLSVNDYEKPSLAKDTILMSTFDGHLYAMRMTIKTEGLAGSQTNLTQIFY